MTTPASHLADFESASVTHLRTDLAVALRAAAHHGLAEGVCNHFSVELPDGSGRFLLNPRGLSRKRPEPSGNSTLKWLHTPSARP